VAAAVAQAIAASELEELFSNGQLFADEDVNVELTEDRRTFRTALTF
jgi:hypothetical protein